MIAPQFPLTWEWRYGCPKSLDWDSGLVLDSVEEEETEGVVDRLRQVLEGHLWATVRKFLTLTMFSKCARQRYETKRYV